MAKKAILVFVPVAAVFALCLVLGAFSHRFGLFTSAPTVSTATILRQVQTLSELVTVKYVLEKIVDVQDEKWYGENHVLLIAHGIVNAGVNLDALRPGDIRISEKKIILTLPHSNITDVYLDDHHTQVIEHTTGLMRSFDKNLEQNARHQAVDALRVAALNGGILPDAEARARVQLTNLFHQLGFTDVEFRSR